MKISLIAGTALLIVGCTGIVRSGGEESARQVPRDPCAKVDSNRKMRISFGSDQMVSVCRADGIGDCLHSFAFGKTFLHSRVDLNMDGGDDVLIKDLSGAYGMHDVVHFMGFVECPEKSYVKVLDDFYTEVQVKGEPRANQWRELGVTRACFDDHRGDTVVREYTIRFDPALSVYGPPDGNVALTEFCSAAELGLPMESGEE